MAAGPVVPAVLGREPAVPVAALLAPVAEVLAAAVPVTRAVPTPGKFRPLRPAACPASPFRPRPVRLVRPVPVVGRPAAREGPG
ncbi:MAG TPA: hypothetical protein VGR20_21155, partial [Acidimicrobiia bacterium]|nr:hypothetical protein [Acidimicrobiia bacterium]